MIDGDLESDSGPVSNNGNTSKGANDRNKVWGHIGGSGDQEWGPNRRYSKKTRQANWTMDRHRERIIAC